MNAHPPHPRRTVARLAVALSVGSWLTLATAAHAVAPQLTVDPAAGPAGTPVTAVGSGFCAPPCSPVEVDFSGVAVADAVIPAPDGSFRVSFRVPGGTQGGANTVSAAQRDSSTQAQLLQALARFSITPSTPAPGVDTPTTTSPTTAPRSSVIPGPTTGGPTTGGPTTGGSTTGGTATDGTASTAGAATTSSEVAAPAPVATARGHGNGLWAVVLIVIAAATLTALVLWRLATAARARKQDGG